MFSESNTSSSRRLIWLWSGPAWLLLIMALAAAALGQGTTATTTALAYTPTHAGSGQVVTLDATVRTSGGANVTAGTVAFSYDGELLGSAALDSSGHAALAGSADVPPGVYAVTANYSGDAQDSASSATAQVTLLAVPQVALSSSATTVFSGGSAAFTVAVSGAAAQATGTVTLMAEGVSIGAATLAAGRATMTESSDGLAPGTYAVSALYSGDANNATATSGPLTVVVESASIGATTAARFLDQSSFGPSAASIAQVQKTGLTSYLNTQFTQAQTLYSEPPNPAPTECTTVNWRCTQSDFVAVNVFGADQLRQRVAMALSEIWVAPEHENNALPFYLNTIAADAFTNYRTIMNDLTLSPAMGEYLNMINSAKPASGEIANENFGRELMQLFTTGVDMLNPDGTLQFGPDGPIPVYTETQVQAFARAYTGWTFASADGTAPAKLTGTRNWNALMVPVESQHDTGAKTLLAGVTLPAGQTAEEDLKGALDNIFSQPNVPPFVCRQLIQHLVTGNPSPAYVARVASVFVDNGSGVRGDMKAVITAILMDEEARAADLQTGDQLESEPAVDGGHLREPLLWATDLLRALGATQTTPGAAYPFVNFMSNQLGNLNEAPFDQPSVFNYFAPAYTIPNGDYAAGAAPATLLNAPEFQLENTGSVVPRQSLADKIIHSSISGLTVDLSATSTIGSKASDPATLVDYLGMLFMHSQMPSDMRTIIINEVTAISSSAPQTRAEVAVYLVVTSSQYKNLH